MRKIKKCFFFSSRKIIDMNVDIYVENCVHTIKVSKKYNESVLWVKMDDIQEK